MESFRLKVFRVAAEGLSFTHAAEKLFLAQAAVTMQIKYLEDELHLRLFDRTGQRLALAPADAFRKTMPRGSCIDAEQALAALRGETVGRVALGASTTIAQYLLPALAGAFIHEHPGVELDIMSAKRPAASPR